MKFRLGKYPGSTDYSIRFRRGDTFHPASELGIRIIKSRIQNGIRNKPVVRTEDDIQAQTDLVAMRRCVVEAHKYFDFMIDRDSFKIGPVSFKETCDPAYLSDEQKLDPTLRLTGERRIFPLTIGILKRLCAADCVQEIFLREQDTASANQNKKDAELAGWLSVYDALNLAELINLSLESGNLRVRIASELLVSAFLHTSGRTDLVRSAPIFLTANHFFHDNGASGTYRDGIVRAPEDEKIIADRGSIIASPGSFFFRGHVFIYRTSGYGEKQESGRWAHPPDAISNASALLEVYKV